MSVLHGLCIGAEHIADSSCNFISFTKCKCLALHGSKNWCPSKPQPYQSLCNHPQWDNLHTESYLHVKYTSVIVNTCRSNTSPLAAGSLLSTGILKSHCFQHPLLDYRKANLNRLQSLLLKDGSFNGNFFIQICFIFHEEQSLSCVIHSNEVTLLH